MRTRGLRRALAALALLGLPLLGLADAAAAPSTRGPAAVAPDRCTCPGEQSPRRLASQADAVFTASVVSSTSAQVGSGKNARTVRDYTAEVDRVFQGRVTQVRVLISSDQSKACGFGAIPTKTPWVFFVAGQGTTFEGTVCGGAGRATVDMLRKVSRVLGQGTPLQTEPPPREPLSFVDEDTTEPVALTRLLAPGAALTLLGLLGLAVFRRRAPR